ncbi:MAG TPA: hypothetical protein VFH56_02695 [Acidimicrobiales bacterium]|nr:hypothetical protein [Acidimicrobiales bacterium]
MSVNLSDYVETLRREVTPPGSTQFSTVSDTVMVGYLCDAFWEVTLDGFLGTAQNTNSNGTVPSALYSCDTNGIVLPASDPQVVAGDSTYTATAYDPSNDMNRSEIALVCLYAGIKIIRNQLMSQNTRIRAKAGPVEYEADFSANLLVEMLRELQSVRQRLLWLRTYNQDVMLIDAFSARSSSPASYSGYLYDWYMGAFGAPMSDLFINTELGVL